MSDGQDAEVLRGLVREVLAELLPARSAARRPAARRPGASPAGGAGPHPRGTGCATWRPSACAPTPSWPGS